MLDYFHKSDKQRRFKLRFKSRCFFPRSFPENEGRGNFQRLIFVPMSFSSQDTSNTDDDDNIILGLWIFMQIRMILNEIYGYKLVWTTNDKYVSLNNRS